jgi:hypothetical protein
MALFEPASLHPDTLPSIRELIAEFVASVAYIRARQRAER